MVDQPADKLRDGSMADAPAPSNDATLTPPAVDGVSGQPSSDVGTGDEYQDARETDHESMKHSEHASDPAGASVPITSELSTPGTAAPSAQEPETTSTSRTDADSSSQHTAGFADPKLPAAMPHFEHAPSDDEDSGPELPTSVGAMTPETIAKNAISAAAAAGSTATGTRELTSNGAAPADAPQTKDTAATEPVAQAEADTKAAPAISADAVSGRPAPYAFTGMQAVIDKSKVAVTALSFGRLDSELLAFGSDDGCLRVARLGELTSTILHEMREHKKRVTDLAWSQQNSQLISASEDGLVCISSQDDGDFWTMQRSVQTSTAALCCRFHPINQNIILVGTASGTVEVFNTSTGLPVEGCKAVLTSREGVGATAMDTSRDTVFVGDSDGYIHALSLHLKNGQLQPLLLLARVPPPGKKLASLASLSFTAWSAHLKGPALLAAGTDDMVSIYKVVSERGSKIWLEMKGENGQKGFAARMGGKIRIEQSSKHLMPMSARPIRASWCPTLPTGEPEYVALGGEDASVNVWDVTDPEKPPQAVVSLQGHCAPVVAVAWAFDERRLASSDIDGTVIVWKREHAEDATTGQQKAEDAQTTESGQTE
mmetsp:Transcript_5689/g.16238  ORF Transcript_5689/g.16238 Transcript_5689/m.16238 type:complete len:600 (-) Transcript_5689:245-2044(-)